MTKFFKYGNGVQTFNTPTGTDGAIDQLVVIGNTKDECIQYLLNKRKFDAYIGRNINVNKIDRMIKYYKRFSDTPS